MKQIEKEKETDLRINEELKKQELTEKNMQELMVRIRNEEIERIKEDEIIKMRNEELDRIMKEKLDFIAADENHKKKMRDLAKEIIKETDKGQKMEEKINDPKKIKEIKELLYKEYQKEKNIINLLN